MPLISYTYTRTIAGKIFNYNKTVSSFDKSIYDEMECECTSSAFCYQPHGHVITGDLSIIENEKLQQLIKKGPKFREQNKISWNKAKKLILDSVENYARIWAKKENTEITSLKEWIEIIKILVERNIKRQKRNNIKNIPKVLEDPVVKSYLEELHNSLVLVPADKAANNVIVICKKYLHHLYVLP